MRSSAAQAFCLASGLSAANRSSRVSGDERGVGRGGGQLGFLGVERIGVFERCGRVGEQVVELRLVVFKLCGQGFLVGGQPVVEVLDAAYETTRFGGTGLACGRGGEQFIGLDVGGAGGHGQAKDECVVHQ